MKNIKRFGVSLEKELFSELNMLVRKQSFPNRSQAIRFLIRDHKVGELWKENKTVAGALILIYDHHKRELVNKSLEIQHNFAKSILSSQHVHLDHNNCLELLAVKGKASVLNRLSNQLIGLKGIKHGKLVMTGLE
ncbi:MAG: nickel-responsive transcriptional regulator NikR [Elusimicrobia bacterium]|nr:nickel-responsive transcriptional regulator NikR [Elusimicrobiota bacterium]